MDEAEVVVFLVRHAKAGDPRRWQHPDHLRPLTAGGLRQAEQLPGLLGAAGVKRVAEIRSSPYLRCRQTVEPLARALGRVVVDDRLLAEGTPAGTVLERLAGGGDAVLCTHGDVMEAVVDRLDRLGVLGGQEPRAEKGGTWVIRLLGGEPVRATYVAPPPARE